MVRNVEMSDAEEISNIYNYYIKNTVITFEETPITKEEMAERIKTNSAQYPWIVYEENNEILGYAYAMAWKSRSAYRYTVESTVYLRYDQHGKGLGTQLYKSLINQLKKQKFHAVIGGIALPNDLSIALHEKLGFEKIAQFKEVGYKFEKWIDVGYWELIFK
ncbi:arsinothricin resistance N-acetyltransferase ArsN1 family B [Mangrovimonas sp. DI 80]|uniref:arsinothricin resistance N-acetyltransferase ArsN1 family B n=1 Tax=Mangrovimonas sp. DI 80 TaxID=1779330 RepID=UPI0009785497|nr:arsinothricin resistance N-acetyltransferase ArsN1 family B [Mangrovimonas sp. DI 80]OMP32821.1 phosphinothricin acetyltransferase [Mangrovimonas sp. DI 80]